MSAPPEATKPKPRLGTLRALWPFVMRQRGLFVAWLLALAVASVATLSLPFAFGKMIDHGFSSGANVDPQRAVHQHHRTGSAAEVGVTDGPDP